jgi:hypothetical protein
MPSYATSRLLRSWKCPVNAVVSVRIKQKPEMHQWKEAIDEGRRKARELAAENDDIMLDHVAKLQQVRTQHACPAGKEGTDVIMIYVVDLQVDGIV